MWRLFFRGFAGAEHENCLVSTRPQGSLLLASTSSVGHLPCRGEGAGAAARGRNDGAGPARVKVKEHSKYRSNKRRQPLGRCNATTTALVVCRLGIDYLGTVNAMAPAKEEDPRTVPQETRR